jgi:2-oxoglutarate ferredoxin oxidoreductase subunit alpha
MHRIGGLEKQDVTGNVSYDPENHHHMVLTRAAKVANIANDIPEQTVMGPDSGDVLVVSWGGTFGACRTAVEHLQEQGGAVSHAHLRYLNPFPKNLRDILARFTTVLVPELNTGQLLFILRGKYLVDARGLNKIKGKPFTVSEIVEQMSKYL